MRGRNDEIVMRILLSGAYIGIHIFVDSSAMPVAALPEGREFELEGAAACSKVGQVQNGSNSKPAPIPPHLKQ